MGKLDVHEGVVLSQSHYVRRRRHGTHGSADTNLVENVKAWWMNRVSRQDLIAWQSVLV
jgi:hypothetical protein